MSFLNIFKSFPTKVERNNFEKLAPRNRASFLLDFLLVFAGLGD